MYDLNIFTEFCLFISCYRKWWAGHQFSKS